MRNSKTKCAVVEDLLPLYIDNLVSEPTRQMIEEHLAECVDCRRILNSMQDEETDQFATDVEQKEVDFLKKARKKGIQSVILGVVAALILSVAVFGARIYAIGGTYHGDLGCDVKVEDKHMTVYATALDSIHVIKGIKFTMNDGVATGTVKAVLPSMFHRGHGMAGIDESKGGIVIDPSLADIVVDTAFNEEIKEVRINDRIYWSNGKSISRKVSDIYMAGHDYIGDVSANGALLQALNFYDLFGSYSNELQTAKTPYGWTINFEDDLTKYNEDYLAKTLKAYGCVLIGLVNNLDEVQFKYTYNGKAMTKNVTTQDARAFFGKDVKLCQKNAGTLAELMAKAGIK